MRHMKTILVLLFAFVAAGLFAATEAEAAPRVEVNGESMLFPDQEPVIQNGRTLVPVRFIAEKLGGDVLWTNGNRQVSIHFNQDSLILDIDRRQVAKNGAPVSLDTYPTIINGRVMVPLRFITEQMGLSIEWKEATETVRIEGQRIPQAPLDKVNLGNERVFTDYRYLIEGKRVGLVTNQTGVNSHGVPTPDVLQADPTAIFMAAYSPEHGIDGKAPAGAYVESYWDAVHKVPVYSLYGSTREPTAAMCAGIDVFLFDMQDIGSRTYTYMSTMNYVMRAGAKYGIPVVILDRPNPLGGNIVEGYMMQDRYQTFVGVDTLPLAHGMTAGELALYFNRKIGADLHIVPMRGYQRDMIWQDTGLPFVQTSPNIPTLDSAFKYMATGMGDGTGVGQADKFNWIGADGLNADTYAQAMNAYGLPGVVFHPEWKNSRGGVRLEITDYRKFNPARTGIHLLLTADAYRPIVPPVETAAGIPMFEKIWGGTRFSQALRENQTPQQAIASYQQEVEAFKHNRAPYLLYE